MKHAENRERYLRRVVEQLVDSTGSYGRGCFSVHWSNTRRGMKELTDTAENTIKCFSLNSRGDLGWGQSAVEAEQVCGKTGNVWSSHGSSVDGVDPPVFPGGSDVQAGCPDIDGGTIIGEVGLRVVDIRSSDGDRLLSAGRRLVVCVPVSVSGRHDDGDTTVVKLKVESRRWCCHHVPSAQHVPF